METVPKDKEDKRETEIKNNNTVIKIRNNSSVKDQSENSKTKDFFVRLGVFTYLGFELVLYAIVAVPNFKHNFILETIIFIIGAQFSLGLILLIIAFGAYIAHNTYLSNIPRNTTLYESITSPTIQYGPLKIILPVLEEEVIDELNDDNEILEYN